MPPRTETLKPGAPGSRAPAGASVSSRARAARRRANRLALGAASSMTSHRIASGLVFTAIFLAGLFVKGLGFIPPVISAVAACWGVWEFSHLGKTRPPRLQIALALLGGLALLLDGYFFSLQHGLAIIAMLGVMAIASGITFEGQDVAAIAGKTVVAPMYAALPLALIMRIWRDNVERDPEWPNKGSHYLLFLVLVTWASDIGAYFVGRAFGRHKLAPTLSPGKSVEGFVGGVVVTFLVAILAKALWNNIDALFGWVDVLMLAGVFSVLGPIGDLAESQLKRAAGMKDSGRTFTGHGGMLDIIDSLLFTTIFYWIYLSAHHPEVLAPR